MSNDHFEQQIWQSTYIASITSLIAARDGFRPDHAAHAAEIANAAAEAFRDRYKADPREQGIVGRMNFVKVKPGPGIVGRVNEPDLDIDDGC